MNRVHTAVLIVITQLEHELDLLVLGDSGEQVAPQQEVDDVHVFSLLDSSTLNVYLQGAEPSEKSID